MNNIQFIDLGLPSGKLWATENVKDENGNEGHFTFDEAVQTFGKNLPSKEDWKELFDNSACNWNKERKGYDVVGPNGNSIFLPAAGYRGGVDMYDDGSYGHVGSYGHYWSSSVLYQNFAYGVYFRSGYLYTKALYSCYDGFSVRLVR